MKWNISFDIAAFFIDLILYVIYFTYKDIKTRENSLFKWLLTGCLASTITDICAAVAGSYMTADQLVYNNLIHVIHLTVVNSVPAMYCAFILCMINADKKLSMATRAAVIIPYCLEVMLIISSPWTGYVFKITGAVYARGPFQAVCYIAAGFYLLFSCGYALQHFKSFTRIEKIAVLFWTLENIFVCLIQVLFPRQLLQTIGMAFGVFFVYLTLLNPLEYRDNHTGTYNRYYFNRLIDALFTKHMKFTVIWVQVDGFAYINEKFGMTNGNILLKQIADFLTALDKRNIVCHMAGTQFAIIVPEINDCHEMIDKVINYFDKPFTLNKVELMLKVYVCCVNYPDRVARLNDVIDTADYILKEAKASKRSCVIYGTAEILAKRNRDNMVEKAVTNAVENKLFEVYYQPIFNVKANCYTSAEALCRLSDKELGFIPPDEFIPVAEKNGQILDLGLIVLEKVCAFIKEYNPVQYGIMTIHVNLSVVQCMQENIVENLLKIIDSYGVDHSMINFEITESVAANSGENLMNVINELNDNGLKTSLDDYGTGYSNTAAIMQYCYEIVKLDKSIVWAAETSQKANISLKYTIAMIKELKQHVLAEGVETLEQAKYLISMGCEYFQGFYYSRPVKASQFLSIVKDCIISGQETSA